MTTGRLIKVGGKTVSIWKGKKLGGGRSRALKISKIG